MDIFQRNMLLLAQFDIWTWLSEKLSTEIKHRFYKVVLRIQNKTISLAPLIQIMLLSTRIDTRTDVQLNLPSIRFEWKNYPFPLLCLMSAIRAAVSTNCFISSSCHFALRERNCYKDFSNPDKCFRSKFNFLSPFWNILLPIELF